MKKVLEDLWYHYLTEVVVERSDKEAEIIKECENALHTKLNEEQKSAFEKYDNALSTVNRISEKNAFIKGFQFATKFLIEALY